MGAEMWPPTHDTGTGGPAPGEWLASGAPLGVLLVGQGPASSCRLV